jgi:hypothetical protein
VKRSGFADTPLHGGHVPGWLAEHMTRLGTAIVESILLHYGQSAFLSRLSDPFWFQALGSVMGMDWHSSGITTSVMGALKRGLNPRAADLGLYVCGGRGKQSRKTPDELLVIADRQGLDGEALVRSSRLTARIDNNSRYRRFGRIFLPGLLSGLRASGGFLPRGRALPATPGFLRHRLLRHHCRALFRHGGDFVGTLLHHRGLFPFPAPFRST